MVSLNKRKTSQSNNLLSIRTSVLLTTLIACLILIVFRNSDRNVAFIDGGNPLSSSSSSLMSLEDVVNSLNNNNIDEQQQQQQQHRRQLNDKRFRPAPLLFDDATASTSTTTTQLQCDVFLDSIRHNTTYRIYKDTNKDIASVVDTNQQKVFTRYMTKYNPPFWMSFPIDNSQLSVKKQAEEVFLHGVHKPDRFDDVERFEMILTTMNNNNNQNEEIAEPLIFWNLQDWGWYPLLGASKGAPHRHIYLLHTQKQNLVHIIRLCEAARMNRWTQQTNMVHSSSSNTNTNKNDFGDVFSIFTQSNTPALSNKISTSWQRQLQLQQQQDPNSSSLSNMKKVAIFKLEGPNLLQSLQDAQEILQNLPIRYLWLEWTTQDGASNNPKELYNFITQKLNNGSSSSSSSSSPLFAPWSFPSENEDFDTFVESRCTASCSLWWKGL